MDSEEKRRLKKLGKALVEEQSKEIRDLINQANPAPFASNEYLRNEIAIRKKEQALRTDDRVYNAEEMRNDFIVRPVDFNLNDGYLDIPGWFWECRSCGDFVPTYTNNLLNCSCSNICMDGLQCLFVIRDEGQLRLVRLMGKVTRMKRWWQFWKLWGKS